MKNDKKMSKSGMIGFLKDKFDSLKDEKLTDTIADVLGKVTNDSKSVSAEILANLVADVQDALSSASPIAENQANPDAKKRPLKKSKAKNEKPEEAQDNPTEDSDEPKKTKKTVSKKPDEEKKVEKPATPTVEDESRVVPVAKFFPEKFVNETGSYVVDLEIDSIEKLQKAMEAGKSIVIANYWNKRALQQFSYDQLGLLKKRVTEFPNDLDLLQVVYISDDSRFLYAISLYTEIIWVYESKEFKVYEGLRFSSGVEFNLYTKE